MQIFVTKDYQEMSEAAADMIVDLVEEKRAGPGHRLHA